MAADSSTRLPPLNQNDDEMRPLTALHPFNKHTYVRRRFMQIFQFMRGRILLIIYAIVVGTTSSTLGQASPVPRLGVMQTAETLGKGGHTTNLGLFQFEKERRMPENRQRVVIGGFEEFHRVELEIETFLVPIRFTYGLSDTLDLTLGGTFSTGGVRKIVPDFYRIDDTDKDALPLDPTANRRVYDQSLFDTVMGLKYNIKPEVYDGLPSLSVGGDVQLGYTADNRLNSDNEFIDRTPNDSFPFVGINTYLVGTQKFNEYLSAHGALGTFLSSKSLKTTDSFTLIWQLGGELAFSENLWLAGDFSRALPLSGVTITNLLSLGFRYQLSNTAAFYVGFVSEPGFQFYLTIGGKKEAIIAPETPETGDDLLF